MSKNQLSLALTLALVGSPVVAADHHAQPRGGGGAGGGSSSAGARHHSGGGSSSSASSAHSGRSSGGSSESSGVRMTDAERRHPRAGTGTGSHYRRYPYASYRPSYWGFGYSPYYYGYYGGYYPYSPYYGGGYYGNGYYSDGYYSNGYGRRGYSRTGSVRLLVDPEQARVYVDGYYSGLVDDFDGLLQRLYLPPGRHEIKLQLEGYQTQRFRVYVPVDHTIKIHYDMVKGTGENPSEAVVGDREAAEAYTRDSSRETRERYEANRRDRDADDDRDDGDWSDDDQRDRDARGSVGAVAALRLKVEPGDASVYVDGTFQGTAHQSRSLDLTPGKHRVEVVRPGYRTFERDVEIEAGKPTDLDVTLER